MSIEVREDEVHRKDKDFAYYLGSTFLKTFGWTFRDAGRPEGGKYVIIATPHTSNWDLPLMLACAYVSGLRISWLGKHSLFRGPGKYLFPFLGGVPVDRTAAKGMVQQVVDVFAERDELALAVPPSGTRKHTDGWKTGFYYIAHGAQVPIVMSYLDFSKKEAGFGPAIMASGDIEADFEIFRDFYKDMKGKFPELTSEVKIREKREYVAKPKSGPIALIKDVFKSMF